MPDRDVAGALSYPGAMTSDEADGRHGRGGARRSPASSYDVAALAGVSQSAVSRAFRPGAYLSEELRRRVVDAAAQLGFRPNAMARGLATNRSGIVAVAVGTIGNPIYPAVLDAFSRGIAERGLQLLLLTELDDVDAVMQRVVQYRVDAMVVTASTVLEPSRQVTVRCGAAGVPVVLYNRVLPDLGTPAVICGNRAGGRLAADLLASRGHRRPAFIGGPEETSTNRDRREGFMEGLRDAGLPQPSIEIGPYSYGGGYGALLRLFARGERPDAVFCVNDLLAIGAMDAARRELRLRVPEDLSVIGFDDVPMAAWLSYDLTTIAQRIPEMVARDARCRRRRGRRGRAVARGGSTRGPDPAAFRAPGLAGQPASPAASAGARGTGAQGTR
jgi:DNA-binding LacI/PurR family transcriptional regulator